MPLENAVVETLAYSDVFDYPLTIDELHRYCVVSASRDEVEQCAAINKEVSLCDGYYFLTGRDEIVVLRKRREFASRKIYKRAMFYGRILGRLPFIRMAALTGSLAVRNCDESADYDYMLVAKAGRVWTARVFALLLNRVANLLGETLCPNLIVSENRLEWKSRDLYSAREIEQMVLIHGEVVHLRLRVVNNWIQHYLPNITIDPEKVEEKKYPLQKLLEFFLQGSLGDKFEAWEMNRKIARFSNQADFGTETNFNADICQGNFGHHGMWTIQKYQERLEKLRITK